MKGELRKIYQSRIDGYIAELMSLCTQVNQMVALRGILFLAGVAASAAAFSAVLWLGVGVMILSIAIFLMVVSHHLRLEKEKLEIEARIKINQEEIDRLNQRFDGHEPVLHLGFVFILPFLQPNNALQIPH